jgi:hypothetical protein
MPYFDRYDICEAYSAIENDWNSGGWLHERPSNVRRGKARGFVGESTGVQLERMKFKWGQTQNAGTFEGLSENGKEIYDLLCDRYGFERPMRGDPFTRSECFHLDE